MPIAIAGSLVELPRTAPEWVQVFPLGEFQARDGRRWRIRDRAAAEAVVAATSAYFGTTDPFIDYDHQYVATLANAQGKPGGTAPAAAWIKEMQVRGGGEGRPFFESGASAPGGEGRPSLDSGASAPGGIWARVEWTAKARAAIEAGEYRYLSPFFHHTRDGDVTRLLNVALLNVPAIEQLRAVASALPLSLMGDDEDMTLDQIAKTLGLPETATPEQIGTAAEAAAAAATAIGVVAKAFGLPGDVAADQVAAAATAHVGKVADMTRAAGLAVGAGLDALAAKVGQLAASAAGADATPDPNQYVPRGLYDQLLTRVQGIEGEIAASAATAAVDAAIKDGKLPPAQRDWAVGYAAKDMAGFQTFVGAAGTFFAAAGAGSAPPADADGHGMTDGDRSIATAMGVSPEEWKAAAAAAKHVEVPR